MARVIDVTNVEPQPADPVDPEELPLLMAAAEVALREGRDEEYLRLRERYWRLVSQLPPMFREVSFPTLERVIEIV